MFISIQLSFINVHRLQLILVDVNRWLSVIIDCYRCASTLPMFIHEVHFRWTITYSQSVRLIVVVNRMLKRSEDIIENPYAIMTLFCCNVSI